jgi:putative ABC transport system substrate-binding protein
MVVGFAVALMSARPTLAQRALPTRRIGVLMGSGEGDAEGEARAAALREGLAALGWREDRNLALEWRWAGGDVARMPRLAAELMALAPDIIVANGTPAVAAAQRATRAIPIVFVMVNDPLGQGFVQSLARPGGNTTGFTFVEPAMIGKALQLLAGVAPGLGRVAVLYNPDTAPFYEQYLRAPATAPSPFAAELVAAPVHDLAELEGAVASLARRPASGLIVPPDIFTVVHRDTLLRVTAAHRLPAIYSYAQFVREGGLLSYGPDTADIFRRAAAYLDRILKGASPGDLPVQAPSKFDLSINLETARALGLTVAPGLLAIADEVVE